MYEKDRVLIATTKQWLNQTNKLCGVAPNQYLVVQVIRCIKVVLDGTYEVLQELLHEHGHYMIEDDVNGE